MAKKQTEIEYDDEVVKELSGVGDDLYVPDKPDPCSDDEAEYLLDEVSGRRKRRILDKLNHKTITHRELDELFGGNEDE